MAGCGMGLRVNRGVRFGCNLNGYILIPKAYRSGDGPSKSRAGTSSSLPAIIPLPAKIRGLRIRIQAGRVGIGSSALSSSPWTVRFGGMDSPAMTIVSALRENLGWPAFERSAGFFLSLRHSVSPAPRAVRGPHARRDRRSAWSRRCPTRTAPLRLMPTRVLQTEKGKRQQKNSRRALYSSTSFDFVRSCSRFRGEFFPFAAACHRFVAFCRLEAAPARPSDPCRSSPSQLRQAPAAHEA